MLVLSHADGLGINLYQLRQGILDAPRNRDGASLGHIELREFFRRQLARRVNGSTGLIDDHILHRLFDLP